MSILTKDFYSRNTLEVAKDLLGCKLSREENGQIYPEDNYIVSFLQILDRREYEFDLTEEDPEIYLASSRKKVR